MNEGAQTVNGMDLIVKLMMNFSSKQPTIQVEQIVPSAWQNKLFEIKVMCNRSLFALCSKRILHDTY